MPMNEYVLTGGFVTLLLFIIAHLGATVWWMAKVTTTLSFIDRVLKANLTAIKDEAFKRNADISNIWKRIDDLRDLINEKAANG